MDEFARQAFTEWEAKRSSRRRVVGLHAVIWATVNLLLVVIWATTGAGFPWFVFPLFGWLVGLSAHAATVFLLRTPDDLILEKARKTGLAQR